MKKLFLTFSMLSFAAIAHCQPKDTSSTLNLGFEMVENGSPAGWNNFGSSDYTLALDSVHVRTGKYAASIEFKKGSPGFRAWAFNIPNNYAGKKITLTGYLKTENVTDGYAGLWMRIDPSIAFNNMNENGIKGTTGWTKYEITLDMKPEKTKQVVIGGLLTGKGKMWLDDFEVTIDGKKIQDLTALERKLFPAEKDKEFDKGSKINSIALDKNQIENLKVLGLIWGFLKYHHPAVADGKYNWDYELFRILPALLASANNNANRDALLVKWIDSLGAFSESKEMKRTASEIKWEPDLNWIKDAHFSDELTTLLWRVKNARRTQKHYYIGMHPGVGNPDFKNEDPYQYMIYPDAGFRLLCLYRYWNIIQYFFPDKNLIEEDWKDVLAAFIPKIINADNETAYTLTVLELIGRIHDTHANIWNNNEVLRNYSGHRFAPVRLSFVENKPVVTAFYDKYAGGEKGLKVGDIISAINNKPVDDIIKERLIYTPASNYPTQLRNIAPGLLRTNDSVINITYSRDGHTANEQLKTFLPAEMKITGQSQAKDTCFKLVDHNIAYINNGSLKKLYLPQIWKDVENTKGLIIDDRNYPSDFVIYNLSSYLMPESTAFVKFSNGSIETPGLFTFSKPITVGKARQDYYKGKVVILVNEITQSSAEFHAMAYRVHPNAIVLGSTTAGADGNVSQIYLPGSISTMISGIGVYYPDGKETQRVGIVPDVECRPTIKGIRNGEDELLNKAIEIINGK